MIQTLKTWSKKQDEMKAELIKILGKRGVFFEELAQFYIEEQNLDGSICVAVEGYPFLRVYRELKK